MPERILITGGSGFIGACLARDLIAAGANVHLLLRPEFRNWRLKDVLADFTLHWADVRGRPARNGTPAAGSLHSHALPRRAAVLDDRALRARRGGDARRG